jgi:AraC-like DNA-binding protein
MRSRGLVTDFANLNRAIPFLQRLADRSKINVVLSGEGRVDARDGATTLQAGELASSASDASTEAHTGDLLTIEWSPRVLGAAQGKSVGFRRLSVSDTERMAQLATELEGPARCLAIQEILELLRAQGIALGPVSLAELMESEPEACQLQLLQSALSERLTALHEFPTLEEVSAKLGWDQRRVHRRLTRLRQTYAVVWLHWREFVHQARMLRAMQLLSVPAATTELVARLSGFRAPSALCHAFARADLPSPGRFATLASAGRSDLAA